MYELLAVARTQQSGAPPTFTELNRIVFTSLTRQRVLNGVPSIGFSCVTATLPDDIKARLRNLDTAPLEVWLFRDGDIVDAGYVQGYQVQGDSLRCSCPGLLGYAAYMHVVADLTYTGVDQFAIAAGLIAQWQTLTYGNFGIDTSGVGTSGVTRDRTYIAVEQHNVLQRLLELGQVIDGFDVSVGLSYDTDTHVLTRTLDLDYPQRGTDLTESVFLDRRNITDPGSVVSVAPGHLASEALGVGTGPNREPLTSVQANTTSRAAYGRTGTTATFDGVSVQATLDDHTQALLDARATQLFRPAPGLNPVSGAEVGSFDEGDTVTYAFDDGLGERQGEYRVSVLQVDVDSNGSETMAVGFE